MSEGLPAYMSSVLNNGGEVICYVPEPDLAARRGILIAILPLFILVISALLFFLIERESAVASAAGVYCEVALVVFALRLCRTSYLISDNRIVRFVKEKAIEDAELAESAKPVLLNFATSNFLFVRWMARFLSLGPVVEVRRLKPEPWTVKAFFTSRDPSRMRIGYPGHSLPIAQLHSDVIRAWESAQETPKATP